MEEKREGGREGGREREKEVEIRKGVKGGRKTEEVKWRKRRGKKIENRGNKTKY